MEPRSPAIEAMRYMITVTPANTGIVGLMLATVFVAGPTLIQHRQTRDVEPMLMLDQQ